jgi:hypothetical protein
MAIFLRGCETWYIKLREEHGQRVLEKRVLREIFGVMSDRATGNWRKLLCKRRFYLYLSVNIIRVVK